MNLAQPTLMDFDGLSIVSPNSWPRLTRRQWADIEAAMILSANDQAAAVIIDDFEERLGTRPAHRIALAVGAEAVNREIGRANERRASQERKRVIALQAPWKPPAYEPKSLAKASRKAASQDPRQVKSAVADFVAIEEAHRLKADGLRIAAEQTEVRLLAEGRGEEVVVETDKARGHIDRIYIASRDGLACLRGRGAISDRQRAAGMRFRELCEKADAEQSLRPMDYAAVHSAKHGGEGFAEKRSEWMSERLDIEAQVRNLDKNRFAALALQEVAGNRRPIRDLLKEHHDGKTSGHLRARYLDGLRLALDVCVERFGVR